MAGMVKIDLVQRSSVHDALLIGWRAALGKEVIATVIRLLWPGGKFRVDLVSR
jgi:hypothetical protein